MMKLSWFAIAALAVPISAQNLPMFRGDLRHSGVYTGAGVQNFRGVLWAFKTGARVISSPAVANGVVYVGSADQYLYAIDQATGKVRWKYHTDSVVGASPAVAQGVVYFGSFDGRFYALDAADGSLRWKFETEGERRFSARSLHGLHPGGESMPDPWDFYLSSPAVFGSKVYFGGGDGFVYALDARTGALVWRFRTGNVVHASPAVADDTVFIGSWDGYLYALEAATGKLKWRFQSGTDPQNGNQQGFQSSPTVVDGIVYTGCRDAKVYAVDQKTGEQKWAFSNNGSWVITSPTVYEGKLYFGTSDTGLFLALDAKTGAKIFSADAKFPIFASPAIAGGLVYVGTFEGKLRTFDLRTREPRWIFQTEASRRNAPAFTNSDGRLDFGAMMSVNYFDEMVIGLGKLFGMGSIVASPVIDGEVVYVGSTDGNLYALR